jgi:hypothetical protein
MQCLDKAAAPENQISPKTTSIGRMKRTHGCESTEISLYVRQAQSSQRLSACGRTTAIAASAKLKKNHRPSPCDFDRRIPSPRPIAPGENNRRRPVFIA